MAITTYDELKEAVARWIGGSDDQSAAQLGIPSTIDDLITVAENRIFREARTRDTEQTFVTSISNGVFAVQSDYIALKFAYVDGIPVKTLERRPPEWIYANYSQRSASSRPKFIGRDGSNFIFGPYPDSGYTINGTYYKRLPALSTGVHALFSNNSDLYLFGALAEAALLIGPDPRIPIWRAKYQEILNLVNGVDKVEGASGSPLQMRIG